ncbi:putative signal transduction protein MDG1 [Amylocarpus encephaloides]|uniref:Signal transduction protein MDG1 n=1 Tax=Amylocarpus encephaloides TaxID=45428 RepID=A0A9P7YPX3_9HELO|nr:putative signal transduction protein MDG1 [Amylocarpus encephaloides]
MGSFVFKWEHPASEVYVTGTFDAWSKSEKLAKTGDVFEKDVTLQNAGEKIYYKFVVDGNWVTDHSAPQENDASGNLNNVLTTDRIIKHTPKTAGIMSGVAPTSTTADLAKEDVPLESEKAALEPSGSADLPGTFPETPAPTDDQNFSVNPLPAADGAVNPIKLAPDEKVPESSPITENTITSGVHDDPELVAADKAKSEAEPAFGVAPLPAFAGGVNPVKVAPGEKLPETSSVTTNTLTSGVHDDPELVAADKAKGESEQTFGVSPLPAFAGAVNPVKVAPGEKLPEVSTLTGNSTTSAVHTDKESYEKSDALPPVLPPVVTPQNERDQNGTGVLDLPPVSKNIIPESSLPIGTTGAGTFDGTPTIQSSGPQSTTSALAAGVPLESSKVPEIVKESQEEAGIAPEASAVPEVKEKSTVEKELLSEVPVAPSTSEGTAGQGTDKSEEAVTAGQAVAAIGGAAIAIGAAVAGGAALAVGKAKNSLPESVSSKLPESAQPTPTTAKDTPEVVKESQKEAGFAPEASANEEAVLEKKAVEKELLSEVKPETSTGESAPKITETATPKPIIVAKPDTLAKAADTLNAPASIPATVKTALRDVSRDVSPRTIPGSHSQTQPVVTSGVASATTDKTTTPSTPAKSAAAGSTTSTPSSSKADTPASSSTTDKKNKRRSFFGRIKDKLKN